MRHDDVYKSLGKSILDEYEDELSAFLGKAMNHFLSQPVYDSNDIDIINVIRNYLDKKLFYVDIGDMPKERAQEILNQMIAKIKEEKSFNITLDKTINRISKEEEAKVITQGLWRVPDDRGNAIKWPFASSSVVAKATNPEFVNAVTIEPKYDIHQVLETTRYHPDDEVRKFVEENWYSANRLDDEFHNLPKLGDEIPVDLQSSLEELENDQQNSGNVDL